MVAPAAASQPFRQAPAPLAVGGSGPSAVAAAWGVPVYAAPVTGGTALVVPDGALDALRDTAYVRALAPTAVRVDLLVAETEGAAIGTLREPAAVLLRRAVGAASVAPDAYLRRLQGLGPSGVWYAVLLTWGWLLLLFAAESGAQVVGALWLVAGLPLVRRAYRRGVRAWGRRAAEGWYGVAEPIDVQPAPHGGLAEVTALLARHGGDAAAAYAEAARACAGAGVADLAPFYAALAAGRAPARVWDVIPAAPAPANDAGVGPEPEEAGEVPAAPAADEPPAAAVTPAPVSVPGALP